MRFYPHLITLLPPLLKPFLYALPSLALLKYLPSLLLQIPYLNSFLLPLIPPLFKLHSLGLLLTYFTLPLLSIHAFLTYTHTYIQLTPTALYFHRGFLRHTVFSIPLHSISAVHTTSSFLESFLQCETIYLITCLTPTSPVQLKLRFFSKETQIAQQIRNVLAH